MCCGEETEAEIKRSDVYIVYTTQPYFLQFQYTDRLFVHVMGEKHEITLGECDGTDREIRPGHNLERLLLNGEFSWFQPAMEA